MIKMISALCRRPGMTHAEYIAYIQHVHGEISRSNPVSLRSYTQNHVFDSAFGCLSDVTHSMVVSRDSVTELYWDSPEDMVATFSHDYVRTKVGPDGVNFSDVRVALSLVADEVDLSVPSPGRGAGAKVLYFLRAIDGISLPDFSRRWSTAHEEILQKQPEVLASVRRCVHSRQIPQFNEMLSYFGGKDLPIYEGVVSLWFDSAASVGAFRDYEKAMLEINSRLGASFYRPDQSFFLYATETLIYER